VRHKWENTKTVTVTVSWVLNGMIRDVLGWPLVTQIAGNTVKMLEVLNSFRRSSFSKKRNSVPWPNPGVVPGCTCPRETGSPRDAAGAGGRSC